MHFFYTKQLGVGPTKTEISQNVSCVQISATEVLGKTDNENNDNNYKNTREKVVLKFLFTFSLLYFKLKYP